MTLIYVEGNIGAGKSTLLKRLDELEGITIIQEPVDKWSEISDGNINVLEAFYSDPVKYAHLFQTVIVPTFIESHEIVTDDIVIGERSIDTGLEVFTKAAYANGQMNDIERAAYNYWFDFIKKRHAKKADAIIYLRTHPHICYERMRKRARNGEGVIDIMYLKQIHDLHDDWLLKDNNTMTLTINNNTDEEMDNMMDVIVSFISLVKTNKRTM
jgi:deoxyadenosine/deoxycytidine kinase